MNILQCNKFYFPFGGTETYFIDLCEGLKAQGHTVIEFSTAHTRTIPSPYAEYFPKSIDFTDVSRNNIFSKLTAAINVIYSHEAQKKIRRLVNKYTPDIAHIHNIYHHLSSSILHVLHKKHIPIIMTLHDYKFVCPNYTLFTNHAPCERCKYHRYWNCIRFRCLKNSYTISTLACFEMYMCKLLRIYERAVTLFIAPSRYMRDKMISFGMDPKKIVHLPYAINLGEFVADTQKKDGYILYFGKLYPTKGIETILRSAQHTPTLSYKIIGDGPEEHHLKKTAQKMGLTNIDFLGYKSKADLIAYIRNALLIVVPSEWYEVTGLSIYEACALKKCVVAARIGGIPEIIEDGINGILFRPGDDKDLTEKIRYLIHHPQKMQDIGHTAFTTIQKRNNRKEHYNALINIYNRAIQQNT